MRLLQWEWGYLPIWPGIRREALRPLAMLLRFLKETTFSDFRRGKCSGPVEEGLK